MPLKLPPYVSPRPRKDGSQRFYFQVPPHMRPEKWPQYIRLSDTVGEMFKEAGTLLTRLRAENGGQPVAPHTKGSLPWLIHRFQQTAQYKAIAETTKDLWKYSEKEIIAWSKIAGHPHARNLTRPVAFKFLETFDDKPSKKKNVYTFLRLIMGYAADIGEIEANPVLNMRVKVPEPKVHIWTTEELDAIVKAADASGDHDVGTACLIAFDIGQRQGDILKMEYGKHYVDGRFLFHQSKTREIMSFEATERIVERLKRRETGKLVPPILDGLKHPRQQFLKRFTKVSHSVGLDHCVFQKLRHTAIVGLARAGCTHSEIASISGHTEASVAHIIRKYLPRDTKVAQNAIRKLEVWRKTDVLSA